MKKKNELKNLSMQNMPESIHGTDHIRILTLLEQVRAGRPDSDNTLVKMALDELEARWHQLSDDQKIELDEMLAQRKEYLKEQVEAAKINSNVQRLL